MKKILSIALVALIGATALTGCGKYPDGPKISLASKKSRLVNKWKIDEKFENGVSQTIDPDEKDDYIEFKKDGSVVYTAVSGSTTTTMEGTWEFDSKKENLLVTFSYTLLGQTITSTTTSKILRLKSKELWLEETDDNGDVDEYHYVQY
ncbi:MAG TPA: hypothetical protein DIU39_04135 [Flavobacteriales bacterium]|nr:hypothetical protein [Flavobacteriales bacterium]|tara:strand:- start:2616 stop:3062 length:447 start_codon:yes stop_codon:yes gene_type:complete